MERFIKEKTKYTDFSKFDFNNIKIHMEKLKEERKNRSDEEKKKEKEKKDEINRNYCFAIVDGNSKNIQTWSKR